MWRGYPFCYDVTVMKMLLITIVLLGGRLSPLLASTTPDGQQILISAKEQANLFHDQASALQLDVDFVAQMNVPSQGHLTLKWKEKSQWWRRTVMGDFEQVDVRNGDRLYTSRNIAFTPVRITELISLLQFAEGSDGLMVKKQTDRIEDGIELLCLRVEGERRGKDRRVCVNSASHDILSDEWQEPPDQKWAEQYRDYFDFGGHRYPRKLQLTADGIKVIVATVADLREAAFDQSLLVPPKGAIERRQCADLKHAIPVKTPDPLYPKSASENKMMGDTTVAMTVQTDGSVTDIRLIGSAARSMDEATLQTLKSWKFKPAMCGTDPVVSDIEVVVSFRLR